MFIYIGAYIYQKKVASKRTIQHVCPYCAHVVDVVSECCNAPIHEEFRKATCTQCGKVSKPLCKSCKRPIY